MTVELDFDNIPDLIYVCCQMFLQFSTIIRSTFWSGHSPELQSIHDEPLLGSLPALYQQTHSVNRNIRAILTSTSSDWKPLLIEQLPGPNGRFNSVRFETVVQTTLRLKHPIQCYIYIYVYMYTVAANQTMARAEVPRINSHHEP